MEHGENIKDNILLVYADEWETAPMRYPLSSVGHAKITREAQEKGLYHMHGMGGYEYYVHDSPLPITELEIGGKTWMVDDPLHWIGIQEFVKHAPPGSILCAGLGLGIVVHHLVKRDDITSIMVVEWDKDVIELITPNLPDDDRVQIINDDYWGYIISAPLPDAILWDLAVGEGYNPEVNRIFKYATVMHNVFMPGVPYALFGVMPSSGGLYFNSVE